MHIVTISGILEIDTSHKGLCKEKKMSKKIKDIGSFGQPSYLVRKFDDISKASYSTRSAVAKAVSELVESKSTKKDNLHVFGVITTSGVANGEKVKSTLVHVSMGLNGSGKDSDYAAALKRLLDTGKFRVVDASIDALDDLWDFVLGYREVK